MKNVNIYLIGAVAYISMWYGIAISNVGEIPKTVEVYAWWHPLLIVFVLGFPTVLGFLAGRDSK